MQDRAQDRSARYLVLAMALAILVAIVPYVPGLLGAVILYVCTAAVHRKLAAALGSRTAAVVVSVTVLVVLLLPGAWLLMTAVGQAAHLVGELRSGDLAARLARVRISSIDLAPNVDSLMASLVTWVSGRAWTLFGSATRAALNLFIALFGLYYLLLAPGSAWRRLGRLLPLDQATIDQLGVRFTLVTEAMLIGTFFTALLQGSIIGLAFAALGLQGAVFWGFVTACVSVLPVLGSALVWGPGVVLLAIDHRYGAALMLLLVGGGIASNIDNLVRLNVYRRVSGIHPMITLVGGFAGVGVFGLVGVLIGPLALSYFFELARIHQDALVLPSTDVPSPAPAGRAPVMAIPDTG
jgi:predicted PurR-regulated permease PerM